MSWKPFEIMLTEHVTPEKARATCRAEARENRLVGTCCVCLRNNAALRDAVFGMENLSHGYCEPHCQAALAEIERHTLPRPEPEDEPAEAITEEDAAALLGSPLYR